MAEAAKVNPESSSADRTELTNRLKDPAIRRQIIDAWTQGDAEKLFAWFELTRGKRAAKPNR